MTAAFPLITHHARPITHHHTIVSSDRQDYTLAIDHKQIDILSIQSSICKLRKMPRLDWNHYQIYFDQKQKTLSEAISVGIHRAYENSAKDKTCKDTVLELLKFIIEKYEEDPKKISGLIATRAAKAKTQLEADIMMGISTSMSLYGCIGSDADADKVGLFLWVFKRLVAAAEKDSMDGKEGVEAD